MKRITKFHGLLIALLLLLLIENAYCMRETRSLASRSSRRTSSGRSTSSRSSTGTGGSGSVSTTGIIVIAIVIPVVFFTVIVAVCLCRRYQRNKNGVQPAGLTPGDAMNQMNLNQQMQQINNSTADPYFVNQQQQQQQMMYPAQQSGMQYQQMGMVPQSYPMSYGNNQGAIIGQPIVKNVAVL